MGRRSESPLLTQRAREKWGTQTVDRRGLGSGIFGLKAVNKPDPEVSYNTQAAHLSSGVHCGVSLSMNRLA